MAAPIAGRDLFAQLSKLIDLPQHVSEVSIHMGVESIATITCVFAASIKDGAEAEPLTKIYRLEEIEQKEPL